MVIDKPCMPARRACSTCLERAHAVLLLVALMACREPPPAPTSTRAAPEAVARSTSSDTSTTNAQPDFAGPRAPIPVLSASTSELLVTSCSPCKFSAGPGVDYELRFAPPAKDQDLQQIEVTRVGPGVPQSPRSQTLNVENGWSPSNKFILRALDLDFDGTLDLGFGPVLGTPNLTLNYWVRSPTGADWISLGKFSNLTSDPAARELVTREKGGHAGMLWQEDTYRWRDEKLTLSRSVQQVEVPGKAQYRKLTRTFVEGKQTSEKSEVVPAPPGKE